MKVIVKEVGKSPKITEIENDLSTLQELVGGYVETINMGRGVCLLCNEEGRREGLPVNFPIGLVNIVGTAVFVAYGKDGEFTDLTDAQIEFIADFFG